LFHRLEVQGRPDSLPICPKQGQRALRIVKPRRIHLDEARNDDGKMANEDTLNNLDTTFAKHGLALSVQHWMDLGRGDDPLTGSPSDIEEAAIRITSLLLVRILAMYHYYKDNDALLDLATSTICRAVLETKEDGEGFLSAETIQQVASPSILLQLETFVTCMLYGYHNKENPFHNYQHAYHCVVSANKFIESMLLTVNPDKPRNVFGLGSDPLTLMALIFAALIHDVGHTGVGNFQRAQDEKELVVKFDGDSSLHELNSLHIAFDELAKDEYEELRSVMFLPNPNMQNLHFETFKTLVWEAVLSTDIATPSRAEAAKVKYFDAFPTAGLDEEGLDEDGYAGGGATRRSSIASNISMPRAGHNSKQANGAVAREAQKSRRASAETVSSDITTDSYSMMKTQNKVSRNTAAALLQRRASNGSGGAAVPRRMISRRHSIETVASHYSEFAADSIRMTRENEGTAGIRTMRRASLTGGAPQQRRMTGSHHSPETGLAGMAYERRSSLGGTTGSGGDAAYLAKAGYNRRGSGDHNRRGSGEHHNRRGSGDRHRRGSGGKTKRTNSIDLVGSGVGGGMGEYDGDSSLSGSSVDDYDGVVVTGKPSDHSNQDANAMLSTPVSSQADREQRRHVTQRRMSNGVPVKFGSIPQGHKITEENPGESEASGHLEPEEDMYGYGDHSSGAMDSPEDLRRQVVMELCLRAADVAHWYQSWDTMIHFNRRIYLELCKASNGGRGFDPRPNWFDNQAKIIETYLLPLAEQLEYIGALRRGSGIDLVSSLESNNDLWLVRGFDVVEALKKEEQQL